MRRFGKPFKRDFPRENVKTSWVVLPWFDETINTSVDVSSHARKLGSPGQKCWKNPSFAVEAKPLGQMTSEVLVEKSSPNEKRKEP